MNEISSPKLNKEAEHLLSSLFYNKIIQLEDDSKKMIVFSKQAEIKKIQDEVNTFIKRTPYSDFEIRVLEKGTDDNDKFKVSLSFKNFKELTDKRPSRFLIVIDSAFNTVTFYQWSLNNILMRI